MIKDYINPSGFPENLLPEQIIEDELKEEFSSIAESFGYIHLETSAVEYLHTLQTETNTGKEIYKIARAQSEGDDIVESDRGLHFDLTLPFARYTAQHYGKLRFPFRRYQIQKVWRGERPQKGRFREFYQADIDVVGNENLPIEYDAEVILIMAQILSSFKLGEITMRINNRKFLTSLLSHYGFENHNYVLQQIDKIDKIGTNDAIENIRLETNIALDKISELFTLLKNDIQPSELKKYLDKIPAHDDVFVEGKNELLAIFDSIARRDKKMTTGIKFVFSPRIARGLDYYTGTVCETFLDEYYHYGSICSGGRYANLTGRFINKKLPGVGLSIGLTRLLSIIKADGLKKFSRKTKTAVSICFRDDESRVIAEKLALSLRKKKLNVELNHKIVKDLAKYFNDISETGIKYSVVCEQGNVFKVNCLEANIDEIYNSISEVKRIIKKLK